MKQTIKWGILGAGTIAGKFCTGLSALEDAELYAVGSRSLQNAKSFADAYGVSHAYGSYEELVSDETIDVIYVATPHNFHKEHALLCLAHGKAVLCEKAFALNEEQAREVFVLAKEKNLFVMEAFWTRFQPLAMELHRRIGEGQFGEIKNAHIAFGFKEELGPDGRLLNPNLAGGALLDVGIYTLSYADMVFGAEPSFFTSCRESAQTGVDGQNAILAQYPDGGIALLQSAVTVDIPNDCTLIGTKARVHIPEFWHGEKAYVTPYEGEPYDIHLPFLKNGYEYEAREVMDCLRSGKTQSDILPWSHTLSMLRLMDRCRRDWNFVYPEEKGN